MNTTLDNIIKTVRQPYVKHTENFQEHFRSVNDIITGEAIVSLQDGMHMHGYSDTCDEEVTLRLRATLFLYIAVSRRL
jgi:hypothetical protein